MAGGLVSSLGALLGEVSREAQTGDGPVGRVLATDPPPPAPVPEPVAPPTAEPAPDGPPAGTAPTAPGSPSATGPDNGAETPPGTSGSAGPGTPAGGTGPAPGSTAPDVTLPDVTVTARRPSWLDQLGNFVSGLVPTVRQVTGVGEVLVGSAEQVAGYLSIGAGAVLSGVGIGAAFITDEGEIAVPLTGAGLALMGADTAVVSQGASLVGQGANDLTTPPPPPAVSPTDQATPTPPASTATQGGASTAPSPSNPVAGTVAPTSSPTSTAGTAGDGAVSAPPVGAQGGTGAAGGASSGVASAPSLPGTAAGTVLPMSIAGTVGDGTVSTPIPAQVQTPLESFPADPNAGQPSIVSTPIATPLPTTLITTPVPVLPSVEQLPAAGEQGPQIVANQTPQDLLAPGGVPIGQAGTSPEIRELPGGAPAAQALLKQLVQGATISTPPGYPGTRYTLPNGGGYIGYRPSSKSGPPTIDVNIPSLKGVVEKLKFL